MLLMLGMRGLLENFCTKSIEFLGGLDCLVNNAGVAGPTLSMTEEIDTEDWSHCLNVCLSSQFYFVKSCLKRSAKVHPLLLSIYHLQQDNLVSLSNAICLS